MKKALTLVALMSVAGIAKAQGGHYSHIQKIGLALGALTVSKVILDKAAKTNFVNNVCDSADISTEDLTNVAGISIGMATFGQLSHEQEERNTFFRSAASVPVAAGVLWLTSTKLFRDVAKELPIIGKYFVCSNVECKGSCKDCKLTKGLLGLGSYLFVRDVALDRLFNRVDDSRF